MSSTQSMYQANTKYQQYLAVSAKVLAAIDALGEDELVSATDLAEKLGAPEEMVERALNEAAHFDIASLHGRPCAWYFGRRNGLPAPDVSQVVEIQSVPNRRAGIVFMHPDETEIVVLENKQIEMKDEFNEIIVTPGVAKKLLEALGFIGGY